MIVAVAGFAAYTVLRPVVSGFLESNDYPGPGAGQVKVLVKDGDTGRGIGTTLEKAGVVKSAKAFLTRRRRPAPAGHPAGHLHAQVADVGQGRPRGAARLGQPHRAARDDP